MEHGIPVGVRHIGEDELELELLEAHRKISLNELRLGLMSDLLENGLCTRDIYSFACTQADLCSTITNPDKSTINSAMRTKMRDIRHVLKDEHRKRRQLERELLIQMNGRSWKVRKKIKRIRENVKNEHTALVKKYRNKINHYRNTMDRLKCSGGSNYGTVGMDGMNKNPPLGGMRNGLLIWMK